MKIGRYGRNSKVGQELRNNHKVFIWWITSLQNMEFDCKNLVVCLNEKSIWVYVS